MDINKEWLIIASMAVGSIGFSVGGTGPKYVRRYIMPFLLGLIVLASGVVLWKCIALWLTLTGVMHLGYGEKYSYFQKFLIGISFILPTLFLGFSYWQMITPLAFVGIFKLSNTKWAGNTFVWKICEFIFGGLIGITIASLIK